MSKEKIICIVGPTASGKTALSIALAKELSGEIVSADSMQIYKGLDVGTAKPSLSERDGVLHHMLDVVSPEENFSVARYVEDATRIVDDILRREKMPIVVGGTGLYVDSLVKGTEFAAFEEDMEYRRELFSLYECEGAEHLHAMLAEVDPRRAKEIHPNNVKRVIRALEVYKATNRTITEHDEETKSAKPRYDAIYIGLMFSEREELYARINARVDKMLEDGILQEIKALLSSGIPDSATAMQAIGYKELIPALRGECDMDVAIDELKRATRRYAKRQMTWFKRNKNINWIDVSKTQNFSDILQASRNFIRFGSI